MRIVYVTQRLPFGTGETFIVPEVEALLACGHEIMIVPRLSRDVVVHDDVGPLVARTRVPPNAGDIAASVARSLARHPGRTLHAFWRLRRTRPRHRAFSNAVATAQAMWLGRVARAWGADHIHAHWAHLPATLAMGASAVSGIPWSFTAHRYDVLLNNLLTDKLRSARFGRFIARDMLDLARPLVEPDAIERAVVLHMGVPLPPTVKEVPARATPVVLCPAQLIPRKGHRYLIDAAARLKDRGILFELWLAGDGPSHEAVIRQVQEQGVGDRVRMLKTVPHAELLRLYRKRTVDCVVLPSLHEGISVALMEAMAYGIPVIATSTGGIPELLQGGAGVLVPPTDSVTLAQELERVLSSAALRAELGRAGRRRIEEEFDIAAIGRELTRRFADSQSG
jgi:colanic acid/amylovoran biosynthesis glycosyltransferase